MHVAETSLSDYHKLTFTFLKSYFTRLRPISCYQNYKNTLTQYPGWIHPGKFSGANEAYKISPQWRRFGFWGGFCIGNLSLPERNCELLMFSSEFLKFEYFPGDIAQTKDFSTWLTSVSFKIYTCYK